MTEEHRCAGMPGWMILDNNNDREEWEAWSEQFDDFLMDINHCPWCGVKLEDEV